MEMEREIGNNGNGNGSGKEWEWEWEWEWEEREGKGKEGKENYENIKPSWVKKKKKHFQIAMFDKILYIYLSLPQ